MVSGAEVAARMGVSRHAVYQVERNPLDPDEEHALRHRAPTSSNAGDFGITLWSVTLDWGLDMDASTKDLRLHTAELLAAADRGEAVLIHYRGKPRAVLRRWEKSPELGTARNPVFGIWEDQSSDVASMVRTMRAGRALP